MLSHFLIKYSPINNEQVKPYYLILKKKWFYRFVKRLFDIFASFLLIIILFLPSLIIGLSVLFTSKGGMFFCQTRVGRYGRPFKIIKFRTMKKNSEGNQHITHKDDERITKVGKFLRKTHLDEFPQLLNVFVGQMSFVGTRPEVPQFVDSYQQEWYATLLMRPGITSTASYFYDDEAKNIDTNDANNIYISEILPKKMSCNLKDLKKSNFTLDMKIMVKTIL